MTKRWVLSLVACMILALASTAAYGQAVFGNIVGTATDPQGAAVANAKVTVTSTTKNTSVTATTNESGNYSVTHLIPDVYKVKFESAGFKVVRAGRRPGFCRRHAACRRASSQSARRAETMEVTGEPPQLQTDKSDIAIQFNQTYVQDLPTLNRNFTQFELMSPGTQKLTGWSHANTENPQAAQQIFVNGQHFSGTNFELDGTDNQDPILGIIVINPNLDAVTEAKIALQQYDAEMGKAVAGYVTAQTKSGSNDFHGSAFWFRRTDANQARNPFTQFAPDPITGRYIPSDKWQQFGGSLGGPIIKNKLFFFGDYQGHAGRPRHHQSRTAFRRLRCRAPAGRPPAICDLSQYLGADRRRRRRFGTSSRDRYLIPTLVTCNGSWPHAISPGNLIPNSLISPQARAILALFPLPNSGGAGGTLNNYIAGGSGPFSQNAFDTRIDWVATSTLNVFGRYSQSYFSISGEPGLGNAGGMASDRVVWQASRSFITTAWRSERPRPLVRLGLADFRFGWFKYNPLTAQGIPGRDPDERPRCSRAITSPARS